MRNIVCLILAGISMALVSCGSVTPTAATGTRAGDLAFLPAKPEKGRVFTLYNYHGSSMWRKNWTSHFDLTGISWNDSRTATAISRNHVVMAAHYTRPTSVPLIFHSRDGSRHIRTITRIQPVAGAGDVTVALLNEPLPAGVKHYKLAGLEDATPMKLVLGYDPQIPKTYWRNLVPGDSGNPAFVMRNGEPLLLTTFSSGGPGTGPFYGDPIIRQLVVNTMAQLR
jgi:hypothetical protein